MKSNIYVIHFVSFLMTVSAKWWNVPISILTKILSGFLHHKEKLFKTLVSQVIVQNTIFYWYYSLSVSAYISNKYPYTNSSNCY